MGLSMHELSDESQQATEQKSPENNGRKHSKWHNTGTQSAFIPKAKEKCHSNNSSSNSIKCSSTTSNITAATAAAAAKAVAAKAVAAKPAAEIVNAATTAAATTASGHDQASCSPSIQLGPAKSMSFKVALG